MNTDESSCEQFLAIHLESEDADDDSVLLVGYDKALDEVVFVEGAKQSDGSYNVAQRPTFEFALLRDELLEIVQYVDCVSRKRGGLS